MTANHLTEADYGIVVALNGIVIVLVSLTVNQLMERRSPLLSMASGALLIGTGFGLYALTSAKIMYAAGVVIWTFGEIMGSPVAPSIVAHLSPVHRRGFYQGLIGAMWGLAAFIGPNIGGAIYNQFGQTVLWICCFVACVLAAATYLLIIRPLYERLSAAQ
jgi:MFS family permease